VFCYHPAVPLSWNEIRHRAIAFSKEWTGVESERAEKQTFWNEFFDVFGIRRRVVASFEEPVKRISGEYGYIDLFWPRVALVEHKSLGKDLGKAESQAFRYIRDLVQEGRTDEIPRYVIVSDFARIALHDLEPEDQRALPLFDLSRVVTVEFPLAEFHQHIHNFAFIPGYKQHKFEEQDPINIEAVEIMGRLHDALEAGGYSGHPLERFLVRVLFCLFGEDTGIFERESFRLYLLNRTAEDGSDLGLHLARLFDVLNTPPEKRQKNLDESLAAFAYVNGELFAENLGFADFDHEMREALLACTRFDWSRISPAIFGSLFQAVMEPRERRQIGGHYTSERDILKVIRSLFLDDLRAEFERVKGGKAELRRFHEKIAELRFLDPACGCGNFLVVTYRELRSLEIEILKLLPEAQHELDIQRLSRMDVDAYYGIEISEWPARIAEVAMWLMDHQMNIRLSEAFGQYFARLPLKKAPVIICGNALRLDWKKILPPAQCGYVLGNPPFVGKHLMTADQALDMGIVWGEAGGWGVLDYVTGWYRKAAEYIQGTRIQVGFVSTNSISQGEQVGALWNPLFRDFGLKIHFAHRTFKWDSEARGKAHVHVVIIGFGAFDRAGKRIYDYELGVGKHGSNGPETVSVTTVKNISPYLVEGPDSAVVSRARPICAVPEIVYGSKPVDGGNLMIEDDELKPFLSKNPEAKRYVRRLVGSEEFINNIPRWCLWLKGASPRDIRSIASIKARVEAVREFRLASKKAPTRRKAEEPALFAEIRQPESDYLLIPSVSSETRKYVPIGFMSKDVIANNLVMFVPGATRYHFGVLSSAMHMAWTRQVCGRLKSDYRYSNKLVYNNFPWPEKPSVKQRAAVEAAAEGVLDIRRKFPDAALADLYDPLAMPPALVKAHADLDRAVDLCYRAQLFENDRQRVEYLFARYEKLTAPLIAPSGRPRRRARSR
jgi:MmeI, DNA-methyltransferase domain/MmeI, target recognition domain/MmeI, N-terminal domain/MmeI, C-terminal domain/MmeI, helicase spacer domain